jgi:hypothetical protein
MIFAMKANYILGNEQLISSIAAKSKKGKLCGIIKTFLNASELDQLLRTKD